MAFRGLYSFGAPDSFGILWNGYVTTSTASPNPWGGDGVWEYVQKVQGNRHRVNQGVSQENEENSPDEKLDGEYPYSTDVSTVTPADGRLGRSGDEPSETLLSTMTELEVGEHFGTWMMYCPPGNDSAFVPLKKIKWNWYGKAQKPSSRGWLTTDLIASDSGWQSDGDFPIFPEWNAYSGPRLGYWTP